jgi:SAM-dependent methyltransferase
MRWWLKAGLQFTFAHVPFGEFLYRQVQERCGELAHLEDSTRFGNARLLLELMREHLGLLDELYAVELGTGWVPAVPLALMLAGTRADTYDVSRLVRPDYFTRTRNEIERQRGEFAEAAGVEESLIEKRLDAIRSESCFSRAAELLGGSYRAPFDTRQLPYADGAVDAVVSNLVLQCIPREVLPDVLAESLRILKPGGFAFHRIWLGDEYAIGDSNRSQLDFLWYSRCTWDSLFNHSIKHLNRLRYPEFLRCFSNAGFDVTECRRTVDWESIPRLRRRGLAAEFRRFNWEEVATVAVDVVLQKPLPAGNFARFEPVPTLATSAR